jgi:hypothetical protein
MEGPQLCGPSIRAQRFKPDDEVVGVANDDHVARGLAPSPAFGPEVEGVEHVDVGQQR